MAKVIKKTKEIAELMTEWQGIEADTLEFVTSELPKAKNHLTVTMLKLIRLEAEKHHLLQQMILDSLKKKAVNLSPAELGALSGHINRYLEAEGRELCEAEGAAGQSKPVVTSYLFSYLHEDLKNQSCLLHQFDDELKKGSIPTSATSRSFTTSGTK
jgi:hypothetical protein